MNPHLKSLGLNYFTYRKFSNGKTYQTIMNFHKDNFFHSFIGQEFDAIMMSPELKKIPFGRSAYIWPGPDENALVKLIADHGYKYGSTVYTRHTNVVYAYGFATMDGQYNAYNLYLKRQDLLDELILYFEEEFLEISKRYDQLPEWMYSRDFSLDLDTFFDPAAEQYEDFKKDIYLEKYSLQFRDNLQPLTRKQIRILAGICEAKTMKEIANELNISPRTVEDHLASIKKKFDILSKADLIELWHTNPLVKSLMD